MDKLNWDLRSRARELRDPGFHQRRAINPRPRHLKALLACWQAVCLGHEHERVTAGYARGRQRARPRACLPPPDEEALRRP